MNDDITNWVGHHFHLILAGAANGAAWAQSIASGDISTGAIITVCTIAVPAVGGAVIWVIRNVGPVWLQFLESRDAVQAKSMSGSMDRLSKALEDQTRQTEANRELAETARMHAAELTELVKTLTVKSDEMSARVEDANTKLHDLKTAAQAATSRADLAESIAHDLQAKLDEALAKLDANAKLVQSHADVAQFGEKVAQAAHELAATGKPDDATPDDATDHGTPDGSPAIPPAGK